MLQAIFRSCGIPLFLFRFVLLSGLLRIVIASASDMSLFSDVIKNYVSYFCFLFESVISFSFLCKAVLIFVYDHYFS